MLKFCIWVEGGGHESNCCRVDLAGAESEHLETWDGLLKPHGCMSELPYGRQPSSEYCSENSRSNEHEFRHA